MRLEMRSFDLEINQESRDLIERRLRFVLGRFGARISRVTIYVAESDSPDETKVSHCRIVVCLKPCGRIVFENTGANLLTAVGHALDRIGSAVSREVIRLRPGKFVWQVDNLKQYAICWPAPMCASAK